MQRSETCPFCGKSFKPRTDGTLKQHKVQRTDLAVCPGTGARLGSRK